MKNSKLLISLVLFFAISISFISCKPGEPATVFEKYIKMKNYTWDRFDQKFCEIPIADIEKSLDIAFIVRHTAKFSYDNLPVYIILTTPAGQEKISEITIPIRQNGKIITDSTGSLYEIRTILWKSISLTENGKYKISIENMIPKIQTEGIDEIGIVVTESKQP